MIPNLRKCIQKNEMIKFLTKANSNNESDCYSAKMFLLMNIFVYDELLVNYLWNDKDLFFDYIYCEGDDSTFFLLISWI